MKFSVNQAYFVSVSEVVLMSIPNSRFSKDSINHLILGDYVKYLGVEEGDWVKVYCRRTEGWLQKEDLTDKRLLEVNFVDIGQGDGCHIVTPADEIILIDAGEGKGVDGKGGDNMARFLNWRYNLRNRNVKGAENFKAEEQEKPPLKVDYAIISHPDMDHYYGFHSVFSNPKIQIQKVGHNGIVDRPLDSGKKKEWMYDLGRKTTKEGEKKPNYLWDTILTDQEMKELLNQNKNSRKFYLKTLEEVTQTNKNVIFQFIQKKDKYLDHFKDNNPLHIEILAPITQEIQREGKKRDCLVQLGDKGKTKNGHSVVFKFHYGNLRLLLGGDLNAESQDYIAQHYAEEEKKMSELENEISKIKEELFYTSELSTKRRKELEQQLQEKELLLELIITKTRKSFKVDIAKACHHGSSDVLDSFLKAINPIATIISSGDEESYSHPRPDALGAFGRASRGNRPLLFSTELARSTTEFSYPIKFYEVMKKLEQAKLEATTKSEQKHYEDRMKNLRDSNVAKYGMITVRTDGEKVVIAQKLERKRSNAQQWDIYELRWNKKIEEFEYVPN